PRPRFARVGAQAHPRFHERLPALSVVTGLASRHKVLPGVRPATRPRDDVVDRQVIGLDATVLAGEVVANKHLTTCELDPRPWPLDDVDQPGDGGRVNTSRCAVDRLLVGLEDLRLFVEYESHRPAHIADV